jgi:D-glycero-alpha-D-manno-heptose 1-phosphate guanylyltransferase
MSLNDLNLTKQVEGQECLQTAVILAGGFGTRLHSVLKDRPKVLAPVAGRPFLVYLLDQLRLGGIRRVVLCLGYLAEQIETEFGDSYRGLELIYSFEPEPLGTAGALRHALPLLDADLVLVANGDSWCPFDTTVFYAWHRARRASASIWLARVEDTRHFGRVQTDGVGHIVRFQEKATSSVPGWANAGVYLLPRELIAEIPTDKAISIERDIFPDWIERGLFGFPGSGEFLDIGTPESLAAAETLLTTWSRGRATAPIRYRHVLVDRDGTVIVERNYLSEVSQVALERGAAQGLRTMEEEGRRIVILTNQSAIARGYLDPRRLDDIHNVIRTRLQADGVNILAFYYCPHLPTDGCDCRKPAPGMASQAAQEHGFALPDCVVIGDKECDIELGKRLGVPTILVTTGYGSSLAREVKPDFIANDLCEAARIISYIDVHCIDIAAESNFPPDNALSS